MHTIDLTPILQAVITLAAALITYRLVPWLKARTSEAQYQRMQSVVETLVYAAEKLYETGVIKDKLDYVQTQLMERGFDVDRAAIEAAVFSNLDFYDEAKEDVEEIKEKLKEVDE